MVTLSGYPAAVAYLTFPQVSAIYNPEIHPTVVWAKFQAMAEGARLATAQLWR